MIKPLPFCLPPVPIEEQRRRRERLGPTMRYEEDEMSLPITAHFSASEFDSRDGAVYPPEWYPDRLVPLCTVLEAIRKACGNRPIEIVSGYRTLAHNQALRDADGSGTGVALNSQHLVGRAADIAVEGIVPSEVHAAILKLDATKAIKIGGLGVYPSWVHVDVRERPTDGHLARWTGAGIGSKVA